MLQFLPNFVKLHIRYVGLQAQLTNCLSLIMSVQDRRRLLGPANSRPLIFAEIPEEYKKEFIIDKVKEDDIKGQISRTFIKTGLITNSSGSAYLELDNNIISVSVYGPRPIRGTFTEKATLNVNLDDNTGSIDELINKKFCNYINNNFTSAINLVKYPKSGIDIFINVISVQDIDALYLKLLTLISNVTTLALINAEIEIIDIVTSSFDVESNTLISFIKNDEIVGILNESKGSIENLSQVIKKLQQKSITNKNALIAFLAESQV